MGHPWRPTPDLAPQIREAFAAGGTVHTVSRGLGITPPTLKRAADRLAWLAEAIAEGRAERGRPHGTRARYEHGCRCADCTAANTAAGRRGRSYRRGASPPAEVEHGLAATYINWGCRCDPCRAANTARSRARRAAHAAPEIHVARE